MVFRLRRVLHKKSRISAFRHDVGTHLEPLRDDARHRRNPGHVDFFELLDPGEDPVELLHHGFYTRLVERDARQSGDTSYSVLINGHGRSAGSGVQGLS